MTLDILGTRTCSKEDSTSSSDELVFRNLLAKLRERVLIKAQVLTIYQVYDIITPHNRELHNANFVIIRKDSYRKALRPLKEGPYNTAHDEEEDLHKITPLLRL
ncbi:hypothetical protein RF11_03548 [Thelohanellus kitauei]|uniref:Uncharacterized protein n=1 Tax=Thelohanellus kitauei TaxID=669202 RepID=A0A0C2J9V7_THEKT|nr:hypothetical protein RF11_03548 [Thelohanellus kitauei]